MAEWWRARRCARLFDVSPTTWRRWVASDNACPQPVIKTTGYVAWDAGEILAYQRLLAERAGGDASYESKV